MKPYITIFCLTYNHVEFIEAALQGFLGQKTSYSYKIFVYDDASTDGTSDILKSYQQRYPDLFDIYISPYNTYRSKDRAKILQDIYNQHIEGEYVAWCEGDDCWIDTNKLQIQVDYMELHKECSMTAHSSRWIDYSQNIQREFRPYTESRYLTAKEVIEQPHGNLSTASLVMRKEVFIRNAKFPKCDVGDIPRQLYALNIGEIYYFDRIMSLYRYMYRESWSYRYNTNSIMMWKHKFIMADFFAKYDEYTSYKFHEYIKVKIKECLYNKFMKDDSVSLDYVERIGAEVDRETNYKFCRYIKNQIEISRIIKEKEYIPSEIIKQLSYKKYIVIMGIGKYSDNLVNKLKYKDIKIDGFVISDDQKITNNQSEKNVWKISECPLDWEETTLIVGIGDKYQIEIEETLDNLEIKSYVAPFWIDYKKICEL